MAGFFKIKLGRTQKEIDDIKAAYQIAFDNFARYIQELQRLQQQSEQHHGDVEPATQPHSEGQPLLEGVQQVIRGMSVDALINMKTQVEKVIENNPKSPRIQEVMTRALRATEDFARNPFNFEARTEFSRARAAVTRLGDTAMGVSTAMGGVGAIMAIVGVVLLCTGVATVAGIALFGAGFVLGHGMIFPLVAFERKEVRQRDEIGREMKIAAGLAPRRA